MSTFETICRFDEAIDAKAMTENQKVLFRETGDLSHLPPFRDGEIPTRFHCRRLKASEMQHILSQPSQADQFAAAFARGVTKVEGLQTENGTRTVWVRHDQERPVATKVIDEVFSAGQVQEVGAAIFGRSILGKGRPAAWPQPAISLHALQGLVYHRAEQILAQDAMSKESAERASSSDQSEPSPTGE